MTDEGLLVPEEPYFPKYNRMLIYVDNNMGGRRFTRLTSDDQTTKRLMLSYARYIFQVDYWKKHGLWIPEGYEVDHIDNNFLNDHLSNYQLLTQSQNSQKMNSVHGCLMNVVVCSWCGQQSVIQKTQITSRIQENPIYPICCSQPCARRLSNGTAILRGEIRDWVLQHQIQYTIRTHEFMYENWYHNYYPHSEIVSVDKRELIGYQGIDSLRLFLPKSLQKVGVEQLRTPRELSMIVQEYINKEMSIEAIAGFLGYYPNTIYRIIEKYDLITPRQIRTNQTIDAILALLHSGVTHAEVFRKLDIPRQTVWQIIKRYPNIFGREG